MAGDSASDYEAELDDFEDGCTQEEATQRLKHMTVWSSDVTDAEIAAALADQSTPSD